MAATEAFVLHTFPWRETSLVVEAFCPSEGRLGLIAKGARRPRSALRGLLQPFTPLWIRHTDKGELRVLQAAEWQAGLAPLQGEALLSGFYLNELLLRLTARNDPQPEIFAAYAESLQALSHCADPRADGRLLSAILRRFECQLLEALGLAPWLSAGPYAADATFWVTATDAPTSMAAAEPLDGSVASAGRPVRGGVLALASQAAGLTPQAMAAQMALGGHAAELRQLLARLLGHHCGEVPLSSRESLQALRAMSSPPSLQRPSHD